MFAEFHFKLSEILHAFWKGVFSDFPETNYVISSDAFYRFRK